LTRRCGVAAAGRTRAASKASDHWVPRRQRFRLGARGRQLLRSDCAKSAGSRVAPSRSNIAGRRDIPTCVAEFAAEFVRQNVDVIVTYGGAIAALKQATASIPIVFALAVDPIGAGLVASLSRPGGNVTGLSVQGADTAGKRLELLREVAPRLRRLAIMFDGDYVASVRESDEAQAAARTFGFDITKHAIRRAEDIAPAFEAFKAQTDALYVVEDALVFANRAPIVTLALDARLPTSFTASAIVRAGGLMSYGPSYPALFQHAAEIVDKILRGTKPGDIPVEQPTKFELAINLKTAKTLGLTVPPSMQQLADEVIE